MKICIISSTVFSCPPSGYAGLEMVSWQQAKGLAAKGHEVALIAPQGSTCPGVRVIPTGPPGGWDEKRAYSTYWKELLHFNDGVIIDHSWNKFSVMLKLEGRLTCPILLWCHAPVQTMFQQPPPYLKSCFVCISEDQARMCMIHLKRAARCCYNGVDPDYYKPMEGVTRTDRYLFLARFSSIKGPDLAIQACKQAGVGLDLIGDFSITNEPELFKQCEALCDGEQIRIVGPASRAECVMWFSKAKALLHPNLRFQEPFGLSPCEAQLCGCPCVAWDHGAMRETVLNGSTGFLVESQEELVGLLQQDAVSRLDRAKCRDWITSRFTVDHMVNRCEELAILALTKGW